MWTVAFAGSLTAPDGTDPSCLSYIHTLLIHKYIQKEQRVMRRTAILYVFVYEERVSGYSLVASHTHTVRGYVVRKASS